MAVQVTTYTIFIFGLYGWRPFYSSTHRVFCENVALEAASLGVPYYIKET